MWPQLETLIIEKCAGLTTAMVTRLALQFPKLKLLQLPRQVIIQPDELDLSHAVWAPLKTRNPPIRLQFLDVAIDCTFVDENIKDQRE